MPATNYTPIQLYRSTTSGTEPNAANMSPGEIALNIADNDMTLYMENASGVVKRFINNPAELKYPTADGTSGQVIKTDGAGTLSFGNAAGGALTNNTRQAVTSSATTTIDLNSGNVIDLTMAANITTLSFTNVPASGTPILIQIVVKNASDGTTYTITWPNSVYWSGQYSATTISTVQTAPTLATGANGVTVIALLTTNGGTNWRGWVEGTIPGGTDYKLYTWGRNNNGQLGLGNTTYRSSPTQVGSLTNWLLVSAGDLFCAAIKTDGTLWTWGDGSFGRLGQGNTTLRNSPVQVGSDTNWSLVSTGNAHCLARKTNGTLWSWGFNVDGQLGHDNRTYLSSPTQIGALTTWTAISASGGQCSFAIKTDGTLWSWGSNGYGRLGQSNTTFRSAPVQVGALTNWSSVSSTGQFGAAIKTDGTLWAWGRNVDGQLGQGDKVSRSSPVQVGALTNWSAVSAGSEFCLALKTGNSLWVWGKNPSGQLGQNNRTYLSSPVQVGALTDWSLISAGGETSLAIKTNGTLWSWGINSTGQLGQNDTVNRSSPVQVGAVTNWFALSSGPGYASAGIAGSSANPG